MSKISKKEIRQSVEDALKQALSKYDLSEKSKKTDKVLNRFSKKLASTVKSSLKKRKKADTSRSVVKAKKQKAS